MQDCHDYLKKRILILNEKVWEDRLSWGKVESWLNNFTGRVADVEVERLHALFWLSQFMYFGSQEIRVLLRSMYRDLFLCPLIQEVRDTLPENVEANVVSAAVRNELLYTRFFGVGNPSESGVHLLYYFRQVNGLGKRMFVDATQIFTRSTRQDLSLLDNFLARLGLAVKGSNDRRLRRPSLKRYIFLDDVCGSGETAIDYSWEVLGDLMRLNPNAKASYYCLFAAGDGLQKVRNHSMFGESCAAVYELDASYRCLDPESRYLTSIPTPIDPHIARLVAREYGKLLDPKFATGYQDSQMLLGFHHNTPDNTLNIIWHDSADKAGRMHWNPAFKRYPKIYGEGI